jgi:hypothetical protein
MTLREILSHLNQLVPDKGTEYLDFDDFFEQIKDQKEEPGTVYSFQIDIHVVNSMRQR